MPDSFPPDIPTYQLHRQKTISAVVFAAAAVLCALVVVFVFSLQPPVAGTERYAAVGDFPPGHAWFNTDRPLSLYDDLTGHVVVILLSDFARLADVSELAAFEEVGAMYADSPVEMVVVYAPADTGGGPVAWRTAIGNWGISSPVIVDHDGEVANAMLAYRLPRIQVVDSQGRLAGSYGDLRDTEVIAGVIDDMLMLGRASRNLSNEVFVPEPGEFIPDALRED